MVKIHGKAKDIISILTLLGAAPDNKNAEFNPLLLKVGGGKVSTTTPNTDHTAFVVGEFKIGTEGKGDMIIDVPHILTRLRKFFSGGDVTLDYDEEKGKLTISNDKMRSYSYPPAKGDTNYMKLPIKRDEKGILLLTKVGDEKKRPTTLIKIKSDELKSILEMAKDVEVDYYTFIFKDENSLAFIGDESDKVQKPMDKDIICHVKGKVAKVEYSQAFPEIMSVLSGKVKLYTSTNSPLWIVHKTSIGKVEYLIAPRIEKAEE